MCWLKLCMAFACTLEIPFLFLYFHVFFQFLPCAKQIEHYRAGEIARRVGAIAGWPRKIANGTRETARLIGQSTE